MATVRKREEYDPDIVDLDVMEQEASTQGTIGDGSVDCDWIDES